MKEGYAPSPVEIRERWTTLDLVQCMEVIKIQADVEAEREKHATAAMKQQKR